MANTSVDKLSASVSQASAAVDKIRVKLVKSPIGRLPKHKATLKGLGLTRMHQVVSLENTPSVMGMIAKVNYMVEIL